MKTIEDLDLNIDFTSGSQNLFWSIHEACIEGNCSDEYLYITKAPVHLLFY